MTATTIKGFTVSDKGNKTIITHDATGAQFECPLYALSVTLDALDTFVNGNVKPIVEEKPRPQVSMAEIQKQIDADNKAAAAWAKDKKVEVRGIRYYPGLSEDSNAFNASVYMDGKKVADAKDDGHGGSILIDEVKGVKLTAEDHKHMETFVGNAVDKFINDKGKTDAEAKVRRSAAKKGHKFIAIRWDNEGLSYISGMTKEGLEKYLADKKHIGYTVSAL